MINFIATLILFQKKKYSIKKNLNPDFSTT